MTFPSTDPPEGGEPFLSLQEVRNADHPAVMQAVAESLARPDDASAFSSFTSHSSSVED